MPERARVRAVGIVGDKVGGFRLEKHVAAIARHGQRQIPVGVAIGLRSTHAEDAARDAGRDVADEDVGSEVAPRPVGIAFDEGGSGGGEDGRIAVPAQREG